MAETPVRKFRVSDEIWDRATERARNEDTNMTERLRTWTEMYAAGDPEMSLAADLGRITTMLANIVRRMSSRDQALRLERGA